MHVLYLIFNEGYAASGGSELQRTELSNEAIRLARMLPDEPEVAGLLALMLLLDARRPARTDAAGEFVALPQQNRSLWDQARIAEARSPRSTTERRAPRLSTGGRSSPSTSCWSG